MKEVKPIGYRKVVTELEKGAVIYKSGTLEPYAILSNDKIVPVDNDAFSKLLEDNLIIESGSSIKKSTGEVTVTYASNIGREG